MIIESGRHQFKYRKQVLRRKHQQKFEPFLDRKVALDPGHVPVSVINTGLWPGAEVHFVCKHINFGNCVMLVR